MSITYNTTRDIDNATAINEIFTILLQKAQASDQAIVNYTDTELAALKSQIALLADTEALQNAINQINTFINSVDADGNSKLDDVVALLDDLNSLDARVAVLESDNVSQKAKIQALQAGQVTQGLDIAGTKGDVTNLQSQLTTQNTKLTNIEGNLSGLQTKTGSNEVRIAALEGKTDNTGFTEPEIRQFADEQAAEQARNFSEQLLPALKQFVNDFEFALTKTYPITGGNNASNNNSGTPV